EIQRWDVSSMSPGGSPSDKLRNAIRMCQLCIFIATRRSIESPWCLAELGAFWGSEKTVILFMADPDLEESALPPQFRGQFHATTAEGLIRAIDTSRPILEPSEICQRIPNRKDLYNELCKLIERSELIRDATWGRLARDLSPEESKAKEAHRTAVDNFTR